MFITQNGIRANVSNFNPVHNNIFIGNVNETTALMCNIKVYVFVLGLNPNGATKLGSNVYIFLAEVKTNSPALLKSWSRSLSLLDTGSLPSALGTWQRLCRVPHSTKTIPQKICWQRPLYQMAYVGHSAKTKKWHRHGGSIVNDSFAECPLGNWMHSAKIFFFKKNIFFVEYPAGDTWQSLTKNLFFEKYLPSGSIRALGKEFFFCRVPWLRHSVKTLLKN